MSKSKVPYEKKVEIVRDYLEGRKGYTESVKRANNSMESFRRWVYLYKEKGAAGLLPNSKNKVYPEDVKRKAIQEYLSGHGSLESICEKYEIRSTRQLRRGCTRHAKNPQHLAENLLDRQFYAAKPNEKWLTDMTEFKWYEGNEIHKLYLSAILDLCDRRIVSYVLSERNDNPLVFKTFDKAVQANPDAHPLFHSDRGFQYTNRAFHHKLMQAGMTQSMSRVAHCIDNGPMEGFWGILKRERYYGRRFTSKRELVQTIENYIHYYNTRRVQRNLGVLTPMEKHELALAA